MKKIALALIGFFMLYSSVSVAAYYIPGTLLNAETTDDFDFQFYNDSITDQSLITHYEVTPNNRREVSFDFSRSFFIKACNNNSKVCFESESCICSNDHNCKGEVDLFFATVSTNKSGKINLKCEFISSGTPPGKGVKS